jgi:hypothetical protein
MVFRFRSSPFMECLALELLSILPYAHRASYTIRVYEAGYLESRAGRTVEANKAAWSSLQVLHTFSFFSVAFC